MSKPTTRIAFLVLAAATLAALALAHEPTKATGRQGDQDPLDPGEVRWMPMAGLTAGVRPVG